MPAASRGKGKAITAQLRLAFLRDEYRSRNPSSRKVAAAQQGRRAADGTHEDSAKLVKHPVLGGLKALEVLLGTCRHGELFESPRLIKRPQKPSSVEREIFCIAAAQ